MRQKTISASELKVHCSRIIEEVVRKRRAVIVTRRGRPVARLVPLEDEQGTLFGWARGCLSVHGDIIEPIDAVWEAGEE